jgi:hypothetical protein
MSADVVSIVLSCLNQLANEKPQFLYVTLNTMKENANDFVNYVVVEKFSQRVGRKYIAELAATRGG